LHFDFSSYLTEGIGDETPQVAWHPTERTMTIRKSTGTRVYARFRSPNDSRRFGTDLGELWGSMSNDTVECFRMFQQPPCSIARFRLESNADLATRLGAVTLSPPRYSGYVLATPDLRIAPNSSRVGIKA
jgi:hypothetical protein